ncbi:MAG TPA: hypothetical protein DDY91_11610 [Planctomycetaceae bacterium]|nr:hypothetical protein [Planctomycetaceae bacterium]
MPAKKSVFLAMGQVLLREALLQVISCRVDLVVKGVAGTAGDALRLSSGINPDVTILDLCLPDGGILEFIRRLRDAAGSSPVLVLADRRDPLLAVKVLQAGAAGVLDGDRSLQELFAGIDSVLQGRIQVGAEVARYLLLGKEKSGVTGEAELDLLSPAELEVFRMIADGLRSGEIARRLNRSVSTIETHRLSIKRKLGCRSAGELSRLAGEWQHRSSW